MTEGMSKSQLEEQKKVVISIGDCGWSLLNHGVAKRKRCDLGNLNPIYERELDKLDSHHQRQAYARSST